MIKLYVEVYKIITDSLLRTSNRLEETLPMSTNQVGSQRFNLAEQRFLNPAFTSTNRTIKNPNLIPYSSLITHSPMIIDNTKVEDTRNETIAAIEEDEEKNNDENDDFVPIEKESWNIGEHY
jgi:hypothetical protein